MDVGLVLIGLTGYASSGKDVVANILVTNYKFKRVAFADPIREFLLRVNPILEDGYRLNEIVTLHNWDIAKSKLEVRRLLQETGLGAREMFAKDFWIQQAAKKFDQSNIVVTDVRFENEMNWLKEQGAQIWRVRRPGVKAINNHISESALEDYKVDQILLNNGTEKDLELLVKTRMQGFLNDI